MASELYKDILKDKDNLNKSNPRTRSFGGLTSGDYDYKNYIAGMRPRTKSNTAGNTDAGSRSKNSSFVDSAARVQHTSVHNQSNAMHSRSLAQSKAVSDSSIIEKGKNTDAKNKNSSYSELSSVPRKKTMETASNVKAEDDVSFNSLKQAQSDHTGSVGRLRSMFDKTPEVENKPIVQLRGNRSRRTDRPHSTNFDQTEIKPKNKVSGIYDRHSVHLSHHQVESLGKSNEESNNEEQSNNVDDHVEHKIDVNSILAPEEPKEEESEIETTEEVVSPIEEQKQLQANLEIERMKRIQEEVKIEKRFHIKRRSLKERLNDLAADETQKFENEMPETAKVAPPVPSKPDVKHDQYKVNKQKTPVLISNNEYNKQVITNSVGTVQDQPCNGENHPETDKALEINNKTSGVDAVVKAPSVDTAVKDDIVQIGGLELSNHVRVSPETKPVLPETDLEKMSLEVDTTLQVKPLQREEYSPEVETEKIISRRDSDEFESEIDQYKSAVERFDDFLNNHEGFTLDDQDPLKDFPNDFTPEDSSKLFSDDVPIATNKIQPNLGNDDKVISNNKSVDQSGEGTDLMNSILTHMEQSNKDADGQEYLSFLRSSSKDEEVESSKPLSQNELEQPISLISPEAPPRLSKLQGRTQPTVTSPQTSVVEEPLLPKEQPKTESSTPERPSSLSISQQKPSVPVITDNDSDSDHSSPTGYYSLEVENNISEHQDALQNSDESGFYGSYTQNGYFENQEPEEFSLPPPPVKSNIIKTKHDRKRKVGFKDGNIEEVVFTYGPTEYDRANADIDPMASSAEWELEKRVENMDIFSVDLQKDERGLGLSIIGLGVGTDSGFEKLGIFVKTLTEKGASQKDGRIQVNDQILEVNGVSLVGVTQFFAAQTLKGTSGVVRFLMGREKSKRTQFSPGAPILENPEMKKHIEEMNKTMAQLEEYESRAHDAEQTLDDVKMELLKAEERAHDAEYNLHETKEMLKAATESPFINGQRKLKNEIKKGGKRNADKVDDLQRSLKDVTNRLSASEENLLELSSKYTVKDKELEEFHQRLENKQDEDLKLAENNEYLSDKLKQQNEELEALQDSNDKMKALLQELTDSREKEIAVFNEKERTLEDKLTRESDEHKKYLEEIDNTHKTIKRENETLKQKLTDSDRVSSEFTVMKAEHDKLKLTEARLHTVQKSDTEKDEEIQTLKDKVDYLQELLTKVERSSTDRGTQIENQYITENTELKAKIKDLELQLPEKPRLVLSGIQPECEVQSESSVTRVGLHSPNLPERENIQPVPNHIFGIKPPLINRESKPVSPPSTPVSTSHDMTFDLSVGSLPDDESVNVVGQELVLDASTHDIPDEASDANDPNPIPKPPRGHFIEDVTTDGGFVLVDKPSADELPLLTSESVAPSGGESVVTPCALASVTIPPPPPVVLDGLQLSAGERVDDDSIESGDQGQFQIIQEDVDEEKISLDNYRGSERRHTCPDTSKELVKIESQEFFDSSFSAAGAGVGGDTWVDDEWKRLEKDKQAELIAEQVVARSPVKRKVSNASSSSDEGGAPKGGPHNENTEVEIGRTQSIKIDSSYFQQSRNNEDSFDLEVSVLDDEEKNQGKKPISKSLSFDSAIPVTPILDSRMAQDKLNVKNKRKPPTREGRKQMLDSADNLDDAEPKQNSLPRNLHNNIASHTALAGAKSVPNLSTNHQQDGGVSSGGEKSEKHKHKFHLPKLFKKSKLAKRLSHDKSDSVSPGTLPKSSSASALEPPRSPSIDAVDIEEVFSARMPSKSHHGGGDVKVGGGCSPPNTPTDDDVVPIREKAESMSHERENEAGTEEAVVPFHQKEESMLDGTQDDSEHVTPAVSGGSSPVPTQSLSSSIEPENTLLTSPDDITLELSAPSSSSAASSLTLDPTESSKMPSPTFEKNVNDTLKSFNERGIDVGAVENGHTDEENTHWTKRPASSWDVRQVGLWLVQINLSRYVNNFKSHNVDGQALLRADGNKLKEYGVNSQEDRAEIKKLTKEIRNRLGKDSFNKGKTKDHKSTKGKLQFWKGKYKPH